MIKKKSIEVGSMLFFIVVCYLYFIKSILNNFFLIEKRVC
ncbi:hypothetical protein BASP5262_01365 [Bacillus spizizenii]|nr:putative membrane protein [Bacillus spizizenii]SPU09148.1 Uncharacterised protein [Bacillus spizizenii]